MTGIIPPGSNACCSPMVEGVTYLRIGQRGNPTGLLKLDLVFQELYAEGLHPETITQQELVGQARKFNYIAAQPNIEADYAAALRAAYACYYAGRTQKGDDSAEYIFPTALVPEWNTSKAEGGNKMLIENYQLDVFTPPCEPGAERFAAIGRLTVDISPVLPYLNATLSGAVYHPGAKSLTWKKAGHNVAFNTFEIAVSNAEDRAGAERELEGLVDLVNRTWERRGEITPCTEVRRRPAPMQVYKLLPGTNCGECGETCWIFAAKLALSQKGPADCPVLHEQQYTEQKATLDAIFIQAPAIK